MKTKLKWLILGILSLCIFELNAQSFQVTDVKGGSSIDEHLLRRTQKNLLGRVVSIKEYNNTIVMEDDGEKFIFNHKKGDTYECKEYETFGNDTYEYCLKMTINKFLGYYKSILIRVEKNGKFIYEYKLERK